MVSAVLSSVPQEAPATLGNMTNIQVTLKPIPKHRIAAFRTAVAARLRTGAKPELLIAEQKALAHALHDPMFQSAMAKAFAEEMAVQEPNAAYKISPEAALHQVNGILQNRIYDCAWFSKLLGTPSFLAQAQAEAAQPAPAPREYDLPAAKKEEVIRRLVQPVDPMGAEPEVHVAASALGQRMVHMALANIFRPKAGQLRAPLVDALARAWPQATGAELELVAVSWLKARHDPAHSIADGLKEEGELYKGAIELCRASRTPVITAKVVAAPATTVATPTPPVAKLEVASPSAAVGV